MLKFPELLPFDWNDVDNIDKYYKVYQDNIFNGNHYFLGKKIHYDDRNFDGKHACFWHLITRNIKEFDERYPNKDRMQRIHWTQFILQNCMSNDIICWKELAQTKNRGLQYQTFLWNKENQFVVILEAQKDKNYRLVSSYCVDEKWQKQNFKQQSRKNPDPRKISGAQQ